MNQDDTIKPSPERHLIPIPEEKAISVLPEYIAAEVFLENSGFFTPSSSRIRDITIKERKIGEKTIQDGTRRDIKITFRASAGLGLPITSDQDYYRAFLKICDEVVGPDGRFKLPLAIPTKKLIRYTGKQYNERILREAQEWFERMAFTGIKGAIYRAKTKNYDDGFIGTVFSQVIMKGDKKKDGSMADTNYVWPSPWFLSNYYYRYLRPLDFTFYFRLRKPIAKSLYPLLETGWYASEGGVYSKSYTELCAEFLLTKFDQISRIRQQLDPAHKELERERFLKQWEYREAKTKKDYVIAYWPGEKFFRDQEAREARRKLAQQMARPTRQLDLDFKEYLVTEILAVCKDDENKGAYYKVVKEYPENLIWVALSETKQADREGRIIKSRGAFFMDTIKRLSTLRAEPAGEGRG